MTHPPPHSPSPAPPLHAPARELPLPFPSGAAPQICFTGDIPGTGGVIKQREDDFLVEELPAYEPCGAGEHIYLFVEKRNLTTLDLVRKIATHFGVRRESVGFAGLKDRFAVTRQLISVHTPGKKPADFPALNLPGVVVHWTDLHTNKLRRGHLSGNRFVIRIRDVEPGKVVHAMKTLKRLHLHGAPNRVGEQRFGVLERNHEIGRAILARNAQVLTDVLLGPPPAGAWCPSSQITARTLYQERRFSEAIDAMPHSLQTERRALAVLARGGTPAGVARSLARFEQSFFVAALQSALFNRVLDERLAAGTLGSLREGDVAFKHDTGAVFAVTQAMTEDQEQQAALAERAARLAISPSGPMWGSAMLLPASETLAHEERVLAASGLTSDDFIRLAKTRLDGIEGARRPLRVPLANPDVEAGQDEHGPYIRCTFELPRGSFATSVMYEIIKPAPGVPLTGPRVDNAPADHSTADAEPDDDE